MIQYFYYFVISLILVLLEQSLLSVFEFFSNLNFLLVFLIFVTIVFGYNLGFVFSILIGLFLNFYSYLPLGTFIFIYLIVLTIINFLYKHILINFSFYTNLILIIIATFLYNFLLIGVNYIFYLLGLVKIYISLDKVLLFDFNWQLILNLILMSLLYFLAKITIKRLNLAFLIKK